MKRTSAEAPSSSSSESSRKRVVGFGTFGVVFKASIKESGQRVALKKFKPESESQGQGFPIPAIREIKILKAVNHINIVKLFSIITYIPGVDDETDEKSTRSPLAETHGFAAGDIFMVFEYVDYDLSGLLKCRDVPLTEMHIRSWTKQLLDGLNFLHTNKILHRDIKGPNILVTKDNVIKIADLGLARSCRSFLDQKFTNSNSVVTLWYRSPELLLGTKQYGPEIDMWSVGCLFGEMKARDAIFKGSTEPTQLEKIYRLCGTPQADVEELYRDILLHIEPKDLKDQKIFELPQKAYPNVLRKRYEQYDERSLSLLEQLLDYNPRTRISAKNALDHDYFWDPDNPIIAPEKLPRFTVEVATDMSETARMNADRAQRIAAEEERVRLEMAGGGPGQASSTNQPGGGPGRGGGGRGGRGAGMGANRINQLKTNLKYSVSKPNPNAAAVVKRDNVTVGGDTNVAGAGAGAGGTTTTIPTIPSSSSSSTSRDTSSVSDPMEVDIATVITSNIDGAISSTTTAVGGGEDGVTTETNKGEERGDIDTKSCDS